MFALWIVAVVIIGTGLVGTIVPGLPGMPLVVGGVALFAIGSQFAIIGPFELALYVVLGALGIGLNLLGNLLGARSLGASRWGLAGALVGLVLGLVLGGPLGIVVGPLIGAVLFELWRDRQLARALRSGVGVLVGYLLGTLAEVLIAVALAAWFVWSTFGKLTAP